MSYRPANQPPPSKDLDISHVSGNVSDDLKRLIAYPCESLYTAQGEDGKWTFSGYNAEIFKRIKITEVSVEKNALEPKKFTGKVVCEMDVERDMINPDGVLQGGCTAFLADMCTNLSLLALAGHTGGEQNSTSQALNVIYHAPSLLGDRLRIVSTTISLGARTMSARVEMWSMKYHRLIASAVHMKMLPSAPQTKL
ncbi:hypothetical protein K435DRAFT_761110 [Dendrothele bispora CBS 962.96]|uniref:Thioesterase domain-containing protein n=1 Tax=Dendrothele bispora (strain CBS 962.96) TaxID=1314807 RepID=A0A4S8LKF2_DENBC|nr:hypothetical protein K435DRAFT_761110 [Dendrothele bispora CBS 962.96]